MSDFLATNEFPGTGAAMQVDINFAGVRLDDPLHPPPYFEVDDVKAVIITPATPLTVEVQTPVALAKINDLTFTTAPTVVPLGQILRVYRDTDIEFPIVDFVSLQVVTESDLDNQAKQTLYAVMEARDNAAIAIDRAESSGAVAVEANLTSQEALAKAEQAIVTANAADSKADNAVIVAGQADDKSDAALIAAQNAEDHATNVEVLAQQAADDAAAAAALAGTANTNAATALSTANAIDAKAQSALDASADAVVDAANALAVATAIDAKAQSALDASAAATSTANTANSTANAIDAKAQTALDNSAAAVSTANSANSNANGRQPGDATLTALAALVTAANQLIYATGTDTFAMTSLSPYMRALLAETTAAAAKANMNVLEVGKGYIDGFTMLYTGRLSYTITAGSAYIPSTGKVLTMAADKVVTGLSGLAASSFYHFYLYDNAGTPDIEMSLIEPVRFHGTAYQKTADPSRRYLGSILTGSGSAFYGFRHDPKQDTVNYVEAQAANSPFTRYSGFSGTSPTFVSMADILPRATATRALGTSNAGPYGTLAVFAIPEQLASPSNANWINFATTGPVEVLVSRQAGLLGTYYVQCQGVGGSSISLYVYGYKFER